jgi:hypothetical protein
VENGGCGTHLVASWLLMGERISDLNLELGSQRHRVRPATLPESRHSQSSRFVNGLRGYID